MCNNTAETKITGLKKAYLLVVELFKPFIVLKQYIVHTKPLLARSLLQSNAVFILFALSIMLEKIEH